MAWAIPAPDGSSMAVLANIKRLLLHPPRLATRSPVWESATGRRLRTSCTAELEANDSSLRRWPLLASNACTKASRQCGGDVQRHRDCSGRVQQNQVRQHLVAPRPQFRPAASLEGMHVRATSAGAPGGRMAGMIGRRPTKGGSAQSRYGSRSRSRWRRRRRPVSQVECRTATDADHALFPGPDGNPLVRSPTPPSARPAASMLHHRRRP
jgi:hypothetical protein